MGSKEGQRELNQMAGEHGSKRFQRPMALRKKLNLPRVRIGQVRFGLVKCQPEFLIGSHFMTQSPVTNCLPRGTEFNLSSFKMFFLS